MVRFVMVISIPALALVMAGCPKPVGGCNYSKDNVTTEQVTIKQISQQGDVMIVEVDSEIQPVFRLSKADYDQCLAGASAGLVGVERCIGHAAVVIDGHVHVLPAGAG